MVDRDAGDAQDRAPTGDQDAGDAQDRTPTIVVSPEVWERRWRFVYPYVRRHVPTREDAEDITQEVMIRAARSLPPNVESEEAWLARVANHCIADFYRNPRRRHIIQARLGGFDDGDDEERRYIESIGQRQSAESEVLDEQSMGEVWDETFKILDATKEPRVNREIVRLATEEEDLSYATIAERLGVSETRVRNVLSRLRGNLGKRHPEWAAGRRLRGPKRGTKRNGGRGQETDLDDTPDVPDS